MLVDVVQLSPQTLDSQKVQLGRSFAESQTALLSAVQYAAERTKIKTQLSNIKKHQALLDVYEGEGWQGAR